MLDVRPHIFELHTQLLLARRPFTCFVQVFNPYSKRREGGRGGRERRERREKRERRKRRERRERRERGERSERRERREERSSLGALAPCLTKCSSVT